MALKAATLPAQRMMPLKASRTPMYAPVYDESLNALAYETPPNAYALGGVSYASAFNDSSYTGAYIGVRLAFRGIIRWAGSVAAFKAINQAD